MLKLTRFDGTVCWVNPHQVQWLEQTPDTVVTMANGEKLLVRESADSIREAFLHYQRAVHQGQAPLPRPDSLPEMEKNR